MNLIMLTVRVSGEIRQIVWIPEDFETLSITPAGDVLINGLPWPVGQENN